MQKFIDEIHENLDNRLKIYSCIIEGHRVILNLDLVKDENLDVVKKINELFEKYKNNHVIKNLIL